MKKIAVLMSGLWVAGWFLFFWKASGQAGSFNRLVFVVRGVVPVAILWWLGSVASGFRRESSTAPVANQSAEDSSATRKMPTANWQSPPVILTDSWKQHE